MNTRHTTTKKKHPSDDMMERLFSMAAETFQRYWRLVALALAVVILALLAYQNYVTRKTMEIETTWAALSEMHIHPMSTEDQLRTIVEECRQLLTERWETKATPWVLMQLGNAYMNLGQPEAAAGAYKRVTDEHRGHYAYPLALPNLAAALELQGHYAEAAEFFKTAAENIPANEHSLLIAAARNRELAGERETAMALYQEALKKAKDMESTQAGMEMAEYRIKALERGGELLQPPPEPPDPPEAETETMEPDPTPVPHAPFDPPDDAATEPPDDMPPME